MATHSSILAWRIPWTEEPGRLQSMDLQRAGRDLATKPPNHFMLSGFFLKYSVREGLFGFIVSLKEVILILDCDSYS